MKARMSFEELTEDEFESLSDEDKSKYLEQILGPFEDYGYSSDFDDEDLFSIASRADNVSEGSNSDSDDSGIAVAMQDSNSNESSMDLDAENQNSTNSLDDSEDNPRLLNIGGFSINEEAPNYPDIIKDLYSIIGNLIDNDDPTSEKPASNRPEQPQELTTINLKDLEWDVSGFKTPRRQTDDLPKTPETPSETFKKIFTGEVVDTIIRATNAKAKSVYAEYNKSRGKRKRIIWRELTRREFYSFLGILIAAGANNANTDSSIDMWKITSYPLYRATMSLNRFWNVLRFMRFEDRKTRDKLGPIRQVWSAINANLYAAYTPGKNNLTLHDQLFPFQGISGFSQYNPSKPAKYGIKIWWVCDSVSSYPLYGEIDTRNKNTRSRGDQKTRRSFFSTLSAAKDCITENTANCGKSDNVMDNVLRRFTTHRRTVKWAMALFFNLLDVATFASYLVYNESKKNSSTQRKSYMRQLSEELCTPVIEERARDHQALKNLSTKLAIECVLGKPVVASVEKCVVESPRAPGPKPIVGCCWYCFKAEDKRRRKTRQACHRCGKPVCNGHSRNYVKCFQCK